MTDSTDQRNRFLVRAAYTSFISKGATVLFLLGALPLVRRSLTDAEFVSLAAFGAVLPWTSTFNLAVGPAMTLELAEAGSQMQYRRMRSIVASSFFLSASFSVAIALGYAAMSSIGVIELGPSLLYLLVFLSFAVPLSAVANALLIAYGLAPVANLVQFGSTLLMSGALLFMFLGARDWGVTPFASATYGIPVLALVVWLPIAVRHNPDLAPWKGTPRRSTVSLLLSTNFRYSLLQLCSWAAAPSAVLIAERESTTVGLFVITSLLPPSIGVLNAVLVPALPLIRAALMNNDRGWIRATVMKLTIALSSMVLVALPMAVLGGQSIFVSVYSVELSAAAPILAVMVFSVVAATYILTMVLTALGRISVALRASVLTAVVAVPLYFILRDGTLDQLLFVMAVSGVPGALVMARSLVESLGDGPRSGVCVV